MSKDGERCWMPLKHREGTMLKTMLPVGGAMLQVDTIEFEGRYWLAPVWIVSPDQKTMRPLRLIAPKFAPGYAPPKGPEILEIFQEMPLPKTLLEQGAIPEELQPAVEVRENPDISFPNPELSH